MKQLAYEPDESPAQWPAFSMMGGWCWRAVIMRAVWVLLLILHFAPLYSALGRVSDAEISGRSVISLILLGAATTFFLLKIVDVRWLRWRSPRAGAITFVLIAALVHDGAAPQAARRAVISELPTAVAASILIEALSRTARRLPDLLRAWRNFTPPAPLGLITRNFLQTPVLQAIRQRHGCLHIPRGPPG